jgi:hypothetical protein
MLYLVLVLSTWYHGPCLRQKQVRMMERRRGRRSVGRIAVMMVTAAV